MQYQLDNLDRRILDALQRDGRLQNLELARLVGLSPSACLRRVRLLEEGGYIDRYVALLNEAKVAVASRCSCGCGCAGRTRTPPIISSTASSLSRKCLNAI